jgi:hypothetical protein
MGVVDSAVRNASQMVGRAATATTAAAGAVGGAAVNGVVGAVSGAAAGVQHGIGKGSHSTPAAVLTLGALGVTGLIEWPLVLAVGGGALLLRQLNRSRGATAASAKVVPLKSAESRPQRTPPAKKTAARRPRTQSKSQHTTPAKKTPARRPRSTQSRSRH